MVWISAVIARALQNPQALQGKERQPINQSCIFAKKIRQALSLAATWLNRPKKILRAAGALVKNWQRSGGVMPTFTKA